MSKNVLNLFLVSIVLLSASCAPTRVELPSYEGKQLREVLASMRDISKIETTFAVIFDKDGSEMRGDAALNITQEGDMSLRIYSLGFLAMEMSADKGSVTSKPRMDRNKALMLTRGLRDCLFWWDMKDFSVSEDGDYYLLRDARREIWFDKKTFLPTRQKIYIEDGVEADISYDGPVRGTDFWYQSKITIKLSRYSLSLRVKNISFKS